MKTLLLSSTLLALAWGPLPAAASDFDVGTHVAGAGAFADDGWAADEFDRRGRGRGRGGDDDRGGHGGDDSDDDNGGGGNGGDDDSDDGHGGRPRIPGGSGCDDPGDILEHPECRVGLPL